MSPKIKNKRKVKASFLNSKSWYLLRKKSKSGSSKEYLNSEDEVKMNNELIATGIFHSLRIPDAVKDLPNFDGNPRSLFDFISNVEEILALMPQIRNTTYERIIVRAIRNKIVQQANEVLNMYGTPVDWAQIKANLVIHYSDKRNETSLIRDLHHLRQNQMTVETFYSKVVDIFSAMTNHIKVHENDANVIIAKQSLYQEMCLNTFLSGLKEPLGSTIRSMKPKNLAEALSFCLQEQNCHYFQNPQQLQLFSPVQKFQNKPLQPPNFTQSPIYRYPQQQNNSYRTNTFSQYPLNSRNEAQKQYPTYNTTQNNNLQQKNNPSARYKNYQQSQPEPMDTLDR